MSNLPAVPRRKIYNILCLGETGSGKTTTLVGIQHYIDLPSWREAYNTDGLDFSTKLKFEIPRTNVPVFTVNIGEDDNENHVAGQSSTQAPKTYRIGFDNAVYNFIDVPGCADTRGIQQDEENSKLIIQAISQYEDLHMILIFMRSCDSRLTIQTTYCLNEALAKLHVDNKNQIGFVITHSRSAEYQAGDAVEAIKAFLENLQNRKNIVIKANNSNVYPVDHIAFRAVVGIQQRPELRDEVNLETLQDSWQESRRYVIKLLQDIRDRVPCKTLKPRAVNEARATILCLMEPLAITTNTIEANRGRLEEDEDAMIDMMVNEGIQKEYVAEDNGNLPMTVCTDAKCQEHVPLGEGEDEHRVNYKVCHSPCYQSGIKLSKKGDWDLSKCEVFIVPMELYSPNEETCSVCGCSYRQHMHMPTDFRRGVRNRYVERVDRPAAQRMVRVRLQDLVLEQERILTAVAHFGRFLKENAIITSNDAFEQVMEVQIAREEDARNMNQVRRLRNVLQQYKDKFKMLNTAQLEGEHVKEVLGCDQIDEVIAELCELPVNGRRIQELYEAALEVYDENNTK